MKKALSTFEKAFIGQFVMVVTNMTQNASVSNDEGLIESAEIPVTMTGFLIDADNDYYYLGNTPDEVLTAIKKEMINQISLAMDEFDAFAQEANPNGVVN